MDRNEFIKQIDQGRRNFTDEDFSGQDLSDFVCQSSTSSQNNFGVINLSGANLTKANLSGAKLNNANLSNAKLSCAKLNNANLSNANLAGVNLSSADLNDANLWGADLTGADLRFGSLSRANLCDANLSRINLSRASLCNADLSNVNLIDGHLNNTDLSESNLTNANLTNANLSDTNLNRTDLRNADLCGANLWGASVYLTNFSHTKWPEDAPPRTDRDTRFIPKEWEALFARPSDNDVLAVQNCFQELSRHQVDDLTKDLGLSQRLALNRVLNRKIPDLVQLADAAEIANYGGTEDGINLSLLHKVANDHHVPVVRGAHAGQDMTEQALAGAFVDRADLSGASLKGKNLTRAVISNSNLTSANLQDVDLTEALLTNVDLSGADLRGVNLSGALLVNCNLDGVKLDGVVIDNTRMVESTLKNTRIERANIKDWLIERSILDDVTFAGGMGGGVNISGFGLYDSVMTNSRFGGNCQISGIELEGSLMIADGGGLLHKDNVYVSPMSEWREQRILLLQDDVLGPMRMERVVETGQIADQSSNVDRMINWVTRKQAPVLTGLKIYDFVQDEQGAMGELPVMEHLRQQKIGYQPTIAINPDWQPAADKKLILPMARA